MRIGRTRIEIDGTPIDKLGIEAVIVPANDLLWTGGGFAATVRKIAGPSMETETVAQVPVAVGSAVMAGAGDLDAKCIVHAVIAGQDLIADEQSIRSALTEALGAAVKHGCTSVAVPILSIGTHEIEIHIAAEAIVDTILTFLLAGGHRFERLVITESDPAVREILHTILTGRFTHHG